MNHLHILAFSSASLLFSIMIAISVGIILSLNNAALGQTSSSSSVNTTQQTWIDKLNNLKIQFTYLPEKPVIDTPTELKFNVQNLQTGSQLNNLFARVVILTNSAGQERSFKFTNISAPNGNFSVKYLFPDSGLYQVISKINSKDSSSLALVSFNVFVPFQPLGTINLNNLNPLILPALLAGITGTIAVVTLVWKSKKKERKYNL